MRRLSSLSLCSLFLLFITLPLLAQTRRDTTLDTGPSWSPDGLRIGFSSSRTGNFELYVMDADGSNVHRLTTDLNGSIQSVSPDGRKITVGSRKDGNPELYIMHADGSRLVNITNNPTPDFYAEWSPDGTRILFTSGRDGNQEVYVMEADGTNVIRLTNN